MGRFFVRLSFSTLRTRTGAGGRGEQPTESQPGDFAVRDAELWSCLAFSRAAQEDDGRDRDRVFGVWPYRIIGQD